MIAALQATLVFETLVDQLVDFRRQIASEAAVNRPISLAERDRMRKALMRLLNDFDPEIRRAAEDRCGAYLQHTLPLLPSAVPAVVNTFVIFGLSEYRRGLQIVPVRGVGTFV